MKRTHSSTRRRFLGGIGAGCFVGVSGCTTFDGSNGDSEEPAGFGRITVEGVHLVLEFEDDHALDAVTVIRPDGELFVERELATGVRRETTELWVDYLPGEYEVIGISDGEEQSRSSTTIEPEVRINRLRLGRNHPEEMYEGASDRRTRMEAIVTLENAGTGPDAVTALVFTGDVPRPTPDDYEESGIYDTESDTGGHADRVVVPGGETVTIYSHSMPFNPATDNVSCSPDTEHGEFAITVKTAIQSDPSTQEYAVTYTGEEMAECDIEIEVTS
jgi:hypothetical protein